MAVLEGVPKFFAPSCGAFGPGRIAEPENRFCAGRTPVVRVYLMVISGPCKASVPLRPGISPMTTRWRGQGGGIERFEQFTRQVQQNNLDVPSSNRSKASRAANLRVRRAAYRPGIDACVRPSMFMHVAAMREAIRPINSSSVGRVVGNCGTPNGRWHRLAGTDGFRVRRSVVEAEDSLLAGISRLVHLPACRPVGSRRLAENLFKAAGRTFHSRRVHSASRVATLSCQRMWSQQWMPTSCPASG